MRFCGNGLSAFLINDLGRHRAAQGVWTDDVGIVAAATKVAHIGK